MQKQPLRICGPQQWRTVDFLCLQCLLFSPLSTLPVRLLHIILLPLGSASSVFLAGCVHLCRNLLGWILFQHWAPPFQVFQFPLLSCGVYPRLLFHFHSECWFYGRPFHQACLFPEECICIPGPFTVVVGTFHVLGSLIPI